MKAKFLLGLAAIALGLAAVQAQQANPIGVPVQALQYAIFDSSGGGSTVAIEVLDGSGMTVPLVDSVGAKFPSAVLTLAAGGSQSIGWGLTQVMPDSTHPLVLPTTKITRIVVRVITGSVTINASGTYDNTVGAGSGIATGRSAPNANSPIQVLAGDWLGLGRKLP